MDETTTIQELKNQVSSFCQERSWKNDSPRKLLLSCFIELGELAEHFQWTDGHDWENDTRKKKAIAFELVDVLFYLLRFTDTLELDISEAFAEKVEKLAQKYPSGTDLDKESYRKIKEDYRKSGKSELYE